MNREFRLRYGLLALLVLTACSDRGSVELGDGQGTPTGGATDYGIAYIKHTLPTDPADLAVMRNKDDLRLRRTFTPQADRVLLNPTSAGGTEHNITARVTAATTVPKGSFYDIKDVDVSSDGSKADLCDARSADADAADRDPPNWNIWEYVVAERRPAHPVAVHRPAGHRFAVHLPALSARGRTDSVRHHAAAGCRGGAGERGQTGVRGSDRGSWTNRRSCCT